MSGSGIAWAFVARRIDEACVADQAALARVLAALGLLRTATVTRGAVAHWPPSYEIFRPWRRRYRNCGSLRARGWREGAWNDMAAGEAAMDAADEGERQRVAEANRARRDAEVFILRPWTREARQAHREAREVAAADFMVQMRAWWATPAESRGPRPVMADLPPVPAQMLFLQLDDMAWVDDTGAARGGGVDDGDGIATLAAFVWQCGRGSAIARLARLLGIPRVTEVELERRMRDAA